MLLKVSHAALWQASLVTHKKEGGHAAACQ
jgi:hypothetical protein